MPSSDYFEWIIYWLIYLLSLIIDMLRWRLTRSVATYTIGRPEV